MRDAARGRHRTTFLVLAVLIAVSGLFTSMDVRNQTNPGYLTDGDNTAPPDPRVPSNWSRRFKNHQEKLKSGDVYQVAEVVRNLAARNRDASLSAAERTMYERARVNLVSEISPALKVSAEEAEAYLDEALAKGVLKPAKAAKTA